MKMNDYRLNELNIGLSHSFETTITNEMIDIFMNLSGDKNSLHISKEFAVSKGFKDRVVYGMLTSSFYSTLVGMYIPGKFALLQGLDLSLIAPVFPNDKLVIYGEVIAIHDQFKQIEIKAFITNQDGKKISRAKIRAGVNE